MFLDFLKKMYVFVWKVELQRQREEQRKAMLHPWLTPRWLQELGLGWLIPQVAAGPGAGLTHFLVAAGPGAGPGLTQELHPWCVPRRWRHVSGKLVGSGAAETRTTCSDGMLVL